MPSENILIVRNDLKTYFYTYDGVAKAVDGVNFAVRKGESFGLVGETGCGKSITALSIMGVVDSPGKIVSGEIIFQGQNLLSKSEAELQKIRGKHIGMIYQDPMSSLDPIFTVGDQLVELVRQHEPLGKKEAVRRALHMITAVQIPDAAEIMKRYPFELSGGMQQRIVIAMALILNPRLIIADEPTTALDVTIQAQILRLIRELRRKLGASMIMISHDLGVVYKNCDRLGILYAGAMVEMGDRPGLFANPLHPYTRGLFAAIPKIGEQRQRLAIIPGNLPDIKHLPPGCRFRPRCKHQVEEKCSQSRPPLMEILPGHWVACFQVARSSL